MVQSLYHCHIIKTKKNMTNHMYSKKHLNVDERVVFLYTKSTLDEHTGTILAKLPTHQITDDYIVMYDSPVNGQKAILITEACLERI